MKKIPILILSILLCGSGFTQNQRIKDSLRTMIQTTTVDSARVLSLVRLSFYEVQPSLRLELAYKALQLSKQINWSAGAAGSYHQLGNIYRNIADYPNALENALKALKIREEIGDAEGTAVAFLAIGSIYGEQDRNEEALTYYRRSEQFFRLAPTVAAERRAILLLNFGQIYVRKGMNDSALTYLNRAYEIMPKTNPNLTNIYIGLAQVYTENNDLDLAQSFYKKAVEAASPLSLQHVYFNYALYFNKINQRDSAIFYARQSLEKATQIEAKSTVEKTAKLLSTLYEKSDATEALKYYKIAAQTKDSIFSQVTTAKLQTMEYTERERQRELGELERVQKEERQHNLQYAAIALGIFALLIGFLVLGHSVIANQKMIKFLGIISLLIVFEFLNLLLHPWLGSVTHHSPVLMLMAMVCLAALLIPLHHKLEHWITHKMVEKNNLIRLAAAKRTIQQLEGLTETVK